MLNILLNNPRNQPDCHIPVLINPGDNEADLIFLTRHPAVIAAMGNRVDSDMETYKDSTFVDVSNDTGIFALNLAFAQVCFAGVAVYHF